MPTNSGTKPLRDDIEKREHFPKHWAIKTDIETATHLGVSDPFDDGWAMFLSQEGGRSRPEMEQRTVVLQAAHDAAHA